MGSQRQKLQPSQAHSSNNTQTRLQNGSTSYFLRLRLRTFTLTIDTHREILSSCKYIEKNQSNGHQIHIGCSSNATCTECHATSPTRLLANKPFCLLTRQKKD